jgi:hypothetical protein
MSFIYLAGPVSGRPEQEYIPHFDRVADEIRRNAGGLNIVPFNPARWCRDSGPAAKDAPWHLFMRACLPRLADSDGIGLLQGWEKSRGARLEYFISQELKIPVVYLEPPIDDFGLALLHSSGLADELFRYFRRRVIDNSREQDLDTAIDRAVAETANRYLDPYGFEYLDESSKEEPHGQV